MKFLARRAPNGLTVLRFDAGALKRRTDAPLTSRQSEAPPRRESESRGSAVPAPLLTVHPWLRVRFPHHHHLHLHPAACRARPPASVAAAAASRCVNDLRKWQKSAGWEMNVAGKQQPEPNERPASLLVPTSVSRPAALRPSGTLTRSFMATRDYALFFFLPFPNVYLPPDNPGRRLDIWFF